MAHLGSVPTTIGIAQIQLSAVNAVATSMSPFTYRQQVVRHAGDRWEASVTIPPVKRDLAEAWVSFLLRCRGQTNTFNLGDPAGVSPRGAVLSSSVTGTVGADSVTLSSSSFATGDYFQLGSGSSAQLYKVLEGGTTTPDVFPRLRTDHSGTSAVLTNPQGVFRLSSNRTDWSIDDASSYGIQFNCVEVLTAA